MSTLAICALSCNTVAGFMAGFHPIFLTGIGLAAAFNAWQVWKLDIKNHALCDRLLVVSYKYGVLIFLGYLLGAYFYAKHRKN